KARPFELRNPDHVVVPRLVREETRLVFRATRSKIAISPEFPALQASICPKTPAATTVKSFRKRNIGVANVQAHMNTSIREMQAEGANLLQRAGINEGRREAASLLMHVLSVDRAFVIAHPEHEPTREQSRIFQEL